VRYTLYHHDGKRTHILKYETLKEAADFVSDECEDRATVWDSQKRRWVTGPELLLAAIYPAKKQPR
jgi:hypothetical protein